MSKIRIQLLDEHDSIKDQHIIDLNAKDSMEEIDEDLTDGNDWFNGLKLITQMWWPYCSGKEQWAKDIVEEFKRQEELVRWTGKINDILYLYLRSSEGSYIIEKWNDLFPSKE